MTTSRERFLQTCRFQTADPPWARWGAFVWPETGDLWRSQGYEGPELGWHGEGLTERFGLDELQRVDPWYGPVPEFEYEVIEEDERTKLYVNHEGILVRELKQRADTSMPQFVRFPVETAEEFESFAAERLALNARGRFPPEWRRQIATGRLHAVAGAPNIQAIGAADSDVASDAQGTGRSEPDDATTGTSPRLCWADRWGGFFGSLRNMLGLEKLCLAFYDQPELVERMMEERADRIIEITNEVLKYTSFDVFWYWEDMAYNHGSLMDPGMFRRFALKHYRRVNDWLHSRGIEYVGLDSDGDTSELIPIWIESGINMLWPFERQAGMDVVQVRRTFGRDLIIMGGIDKRAIAEGGDVMRREVDRVMPLVEEGGYMPEPDHSIPPDVSWPDFCEYVDYVKYRLGRG